jgi:CheY-like chemotaxis protein
METADNGGQALELLRSREYGLLIIDPLLPGIDGLELAVRPGEGENSIGRHLRAIVLSEPDQDYSAQQLFDAGFQDNLPRPLTDEGLRAVLAYWLPTAAPEEQPPGQSRDQDPFPQPPPTNGLPGHLVRRWEFLRERKKYWLLPMIFVVVVFLIMILMSGNSTNYPIMRK